jgi:hypothetical protein
MRGPAASATRINTNCRIQFFAHRRQKLPIIEQRLRYVAILLATLRWEM